MAVRKVAIGSLIIVLYGTVAFADSPITRLANALFQNMANTYGCRTLIGGTAQYDAAKVIARDNIATYLGDAEAVKMVEQMDRRFRNDPRGDSPPDGATLEICLDVINQGLEEISAAKAALD